MTKLILPALATLFLMTLVSPALAQNVIDLNDPDVVINDRDVQSDDTETGLSEEEEEQLSEEDRPADINDNAKLRADFNQNVQDPDSKEVEFELLLYSNVDSDRVKITWDVVGQSAFAENNPNIDILSPTQATRTIEVKAGEGYRVPIRIQPVGAGISEVKIKAELFEANARTVSVVRKNYATNADSEILPLSEEYEAAKSRYTTTRLITRTAIIAVIGIGGFLAFRAGVRWYKADEVVEFEKRRR